MKLDAEQSSMPWSGVEIIGVELIGSMDLRKDRDRWMEHGRDRRRESRWDTRRGWAARTRARPRGVSVGDAADGGVRPRAEALSTLSEWAEFFIF